MKFSLPFIVIGSLAVAGCGIAPAATNSPNIREDMRTDLLTTNKVVCINESLYFVSTVDGHSVIGSPVVDPDMSNGIVSCINGIPLNQFGKFQ